MQSIKWTGKGEWAGGDSSQALAEILSAFPRVKTYSAEIKEDRFRCFIQLARGEHSFQAHYDLSSWKVGYRFWGFKCVIEADWKVQIQANSPAESLDLAIGSLKEKIVFLMEELSNQNGKSVEESL
jgi:hypothetical protein